MTTTKPPVRPILKWAGGKTQLLDRILPLIPDDFTTYCEPFIGGGAVCFAAQPRTAIITDVNPDLIALYRTVQANVEELVDLLRTYGNTPEEYYEIRALDRNPGWKDEPDLLHAARMLYLNRTCFNGLYRVNAAGQFNVPYGKYKNPDTVNEAKLRDLHAYLSANDVQIKFQDFAQTLKLLPEGAFAYLDPPYDPISPTAAFTSYAKDSFGRSDQTRLRDACDLMTIRGIKFLESNSDTPFIRELYKDYHIHTVQARRSVGASGTTRQSVNEVLISNF